MFPRPFQLRFHLTQQLLDVSRLASQCPPFYTAPLIANVVLVYRTWFWFLHVGSVRYQPTNVISYVRVCGTRQGHTRSGPYSLTGGGSYSDRRYSDKYACSETSWSAHLCCKLHSLFYAEFGAEFTSLSRPLRHSQCLHFDLTELTKLKFLLGSYIF